jgi:hypothetical protein
MAIKSPAASAKTDLTGPKHARLKEKPKRDRRARVEWVPGMLYMREITKGDGTYSFLCFFQPESIRMYLLALYNPRLNRTTRCMKVQPALFEYNHKKEQSSGYAVVYREATDQDLELIFKHWNQDVSGIGLIEWFKSSRLLQDLIAEDHARIERLLQSLQDVS